MDFLKVKGIIFDVHKTLVDDSGFPRDRIWRLIKQSGIHFDLDEYYILYDTLTREFFNWPEIDPFITVREVHRKRLMRIYQHFNVDRNIDQDLSYLWKCMSTSRIYPEVPEVLKAISKKFKMALLSNADKDDPLIQILLTRGFAFDTIVTSHQIKRYKPDPNIFYFTLEQMRLKRDEVIMVGDSPISDIKGAKNAGIKIIWVNRKKVPLSDQFPEPDFQIQNLKELLKLITN